MVMQRYSEQREQIYQTVCASREHPTAQMVYDQLHPRMPKLSLGTVYRNLQQMARDGRLAEIDGPVARFDAILQPHTHLRCQFCGSLADAELPYNPALDRVCRGSGWKVTGYHLTFTGICPACAGNNKESSEIKHF